MKNLSELCISPTPWTYTMLSEPCVDVYSVEVHADQGSIRIGTFDIWDGSFSRRESIANARLITNAPKLYDALQRIVSAADESVLDVNEWRKNLHEALEDARVALAYASGEKED